MLPTFVTLLFIAGTLWASATAHDEKRWRYPFFAAVACAGWLTIWVARSLRHLLLEIEINLYAPVAIALVALPFCAVLGSVMVRRQNTPRHSPSIDDDPTLRRHVAEKTRRARKRRQEEAELENSDQPSA
jgi:hypothetical protein